MNPPASPDRSRPLGPALAASLLCLGIAVAGCMASEPPPGEVVGTPAGRTMDAVILASFPHPSGEGHPGNTVMPSASRDGPTLVAAVDDPWTNTILLATREGNATRLERIVPHRSVEHLQVGRFSGEDFLAFREDLDTLVVLHREGAAWSAAFPPKAETAVAVAYPEFASSAGEFFLAYVELRRDGGFSMAIARMTDQVERGDFTSWEVRRIDPPEPGIGVPAIAFVEGRMLVVVPEGLGRLALYEAAWDEPWRRSVIREPDAPLDARYAVQPTIAGVAGAPHVAWSKLPLVGGLPAHEEAGRLFVGKHPEWAWTDAGVRGVPDGPRTSAELNGTFAVFEGGQAYAWSGTGRMTVLMDTGCEQLGPVGTGNAREVFLLHDGGAAYELGHIPDYASTGPTDPCQGTAMAPPLGGGPFAAEGTGVRPKGGMPPLRGNPFSLTRPRRPDRDGLALPRPRPACRGHLVRRLPFVARRGPRTSPGASRRPCAARRSRTRCARSWGRCRARLQGSP